MRHCPDCRRIYPPEVVSCPECRVELLDGPSPAGEDPGVAWENLVELREVPDPVTAAMWQGALESQGLHPVLRSNTVPMYGGVLRDWKTRSWGTLLVPDAELAEARLVLEDFLATARSRGPVEEEEGDSGPADPRSA